VATAYVLRSAFRLHRPYYVRRCGLLLPTEQCGLSVCLSVTLVIGSADWDAVWDEDTGGPREWCIRWCPDPRMRRDNLGKGRQLQSIRTFWNWGIFEVVGEFSSKKVPE